jgi:peptidoglycan/xylan/chitin deacetylase (PgdA/CDA1 family)
MIAALAQVSGLIGAMERRHRNNLTVLCYHRVLPQEQRDKYFDSELVVTPEVFDAHCETLAKHFDVITLESGLADWRAGVLSDRPRAAITFDDGYRDNENYAAPILARHGLNATFYIVAGLVGTDGQSWYDRAGRALVALGRNAASEVGAAKALTPFDRQQWLSSLEAEAGPANLQVDDLIMDRAALRRLVAAGHAIGSHTVTHPLLDQLEPSKQRDEVIRSKHMLEEASGSKVVGFSYPNGNLNDLVKAAVSEGAYGYAVSAFPGVNQRDADPLALKRWFISQNRLCAADGAPSSSLFRMEICGLADRIFKRGAVS